LFWVKNANFFAEFFGENILRIIFFFFYVSPAGEASGKG
jgi:hypothetical protein